MAYLFSRKVNFKHTHCKHLEPFPFYQAFVPEVPQIFIQKIFFILFTLAIIWVHESWKFTFFPQNSKGYLKNHWTNTRPSLFVLIWIHVSWWIHIQWQKFQFWNCLKKMKLLNCHLQSSANCLWINLILLFLFCFVFCFVLVFVVCLFVFVLLFWKLTFASQTRFSVCTLWLHESKSMPIGNYVKSASHSWK